MKQSSAGALALMLGASAFSMPPTEADGIGYSLDTKRPSGGKKKHTAQRRNKKKLVKKSRRGNRRK
jgi:hypothetical protein